MCHNALNNPATVNRISSCVWSRYPTSAPTAITKSGPDLRLVRPRPNSACATIAMMIGRTPPPGALRPEVDRQLGGVRTGNEIGCAHELQELVVVEPSPTAHHFVAHHGDVRSWTSEADHTQSQEQTGNFTKRLACAIGRRRTETVRLAGHV